MPRTTVSQEMQQALNRHSDFGPLKVEMRTIWDWQKRVTRLEKLVAKLRADLKAAGKESADDISEDESCEAK